MIRRDYFLRMVQELVQALQRATFLKQRQDYDAALQEIDRTLARFWDLSPDQLRQLTLDHWINLSWQEGGNVGEKLVALADLFHEQGDLYVLKQFPKEAGHSYCMALGLFLETLRTSMVSVDLLQKTGALIEQTRDAQRPPALMRMLVGYFEARGHYALAEDTLFSWLETRDAQAVSEGLKLYERLLEKSDAELTAGGLPRPEVEEGHRELLARVPPPQIPQSK